MKSFVSILLLLSMLLLCVSCTVDTPANEFDSSEEHDNGSKHYEIDLTLENFSTFLTYSTESNPGYRTSSPDYYHFISGVLSFAYYENVSVTFEVVYTYDKYTYGGKTYTCEYTVPLNAAGNATFAAYDQDLLDALQVEGSNSASKRTYTIKDVSGKVNFTA